MNLDKMFIKILFFDKISHYLGYRHSNKETLTILLVTTFFLYLKFFITPWNMLLVKRHHLFCNTPFYSLRKYLTFCINSSVAREAQQMFQMASYLCMYLTLILSFFRNRDYTRATAYRAGEQNSIPREVIFFLFK